MNVDDTFPLKLFINLSRREDRRFRMDLEFFHLGWHVQRVRAVNMKFVRRLGGYPTPFRYAKALSHRLALRRARLARAPAVLILEDDVVFAPDALERLEAIELPHDWGIFYLGCRHVERPQSATPGVVRVGKALDTHAYAVRSAYFATLLHRFRLAARDSSCAEVSESGVDSVLAEMQEEIPTYACWPNVAWQLPDEPDPLKPTSQKYTDDGRQLTWPEAVRGLIHGTSREFIPREPVETSNHRPGPSARGHDLPRGKEPPASLPQARKGSLIYTVALDEASEGSMPCRRMAQLLVSSLLRTGTSAEILVIRREGVPLFDFPVEGVREVGVTPEPSSAWHGAATRWKMRAREFIDRGRYERILFLDCDCLVLRSPDWLLVGDWDLAFQVESDRSIRQEFFNSYLTDEELKRPIWPAINSGTFAVRGDYFHGLMERWEQILQSPPLRPLFRAGSDQSGWNRAVVDVLTGAWKGGATKPLHSLSFPRESVRLLHLHGLWSDDHALATILHYSAVGDHATRAAQMTEAYLQLFYAGEPTPVTQIQDSWSALEEAQPVESPSRNSSCRETFTPIKPLEEKSPSTTRVPTRWYRFEHLAEFGPAAVYRDDYEWLVEFTAATCVRRVLEFGPGDSTLAFLENDCEVVSFENDRDWLIRARRRFAAFPQVTVLPYHDHPDWTSPLVDPARWRPDLAFIDGPQVVASDQIARWNTCCFAARACDVLILHDAKRPTERRTAELMETKGWRVEFVPTEKGLLVMRRSDSSAS